jgi:DNA polymerase-3 subunit chi
MTRVDFYLLPGADPQARRVLACKLTEKAWRLGMKVHIHTDSEGEAEQMDKLLWTFRQGSFIPHARTTAPPAEREDIAVLIGPSPAPAGFSELLINLALEIPEDFQHCQRIAELLDEDATLRAAGRRRYAAYKQHGCALETHKLSGY